MTQTSKDLLNESLSALVDNQASELEVRRLLKHLDQNPELLTQWRSYHLCGEVMRGQTPAFINLDISAAVSAAVAQETSVAGQVNKPRWYAWMGKSAVAASVAVAVILGAQQFSAGPGVAPLAQAPADETLNEAPGLSAVNESESLVASLPEPSGSLAAPEGFAVPLPDARTVSSNAAAVGNGGLQVRPVSTPMDWRKDPELQAELNQLLIDHASRASANGSLGILPFARVSAMPAEK